LIQIHGVDVWISLDSYLKIGDIHGLNSTKVSGFIKKLKFVAFVLGAHKIKFQCNELDKNYDLLSKHIKPKEGLPIIFKNLSNRFSTDGFSMKYADVDTF
jgi:hypothetical protein